MSMLTSLATPEFVSALMIGSTALDVVGEISRSSQEAKNARTQAKIAEMNAARNEAAARRDTIRKLGAMRAAYGKSGVQLSGTPVEVLADTAAEGELDALTERWSGQSESAMLRRRASDTEASGLFGAGTSLLAGGAKVYDRWANRRG